MKSQFIIIVGYEFKGTVYMKEVDAPTGAEKMYCAFYSGCSVPTETFPLHLVEGCDFSLEKLIVALRKRYVVEYITTFLTPSFMDLDIKDRKEFCVYEEADCGLHIKAQDVSYGENTLNSAQLFSTVFRKDSDEESVYKLDFSALFRKDSTKIQDVFKEYYTEKYNEFEAQL